MRVRRCVPLGRRNLLSAPRRLVASAIGVGLAVMLILLLDGLWAGLRAQTTAYTDHAGADLYVLEPGVRDLTAGASSLRVDTADTVRADPDVDWVAPVDTSYAIVDVHGRKVATYVVGSAPGAPGGAWSLRSGRLPVADDEIVVGTALADRHGIGLDDTIVVMGRELRVVGTAATNGFMIPYLFVTAGAFERSGRAPDTTSVLLVSTDKPTAVADRLRAEGLNVLTREEVRRNNIRFMTGVFGSPIRLMVGIGFIAGTLIVALTAYTAVVERRREYGIVKALGSGPWRLVGLAIAHTLVLAVLGLAAGWLLYLAGRAAIVASRPQFAIVLTPSSFLRAAAAALAMAIVAAVLPARRLVALEPALAFRSPS